MSGVVALFPGQGLKPGDCARDEIASAVPALLAECEERLGCDPFALEEWSVSMAQPALYCASLARFAGDDVARGADCMTGHSLGEITALAAAGAMSYSDGLRLVIERGRLTERAVGGSGTGMLAVGVDVEAGEALAATVGAVVANDNSPGQVVIAGPIAALETAAAEARAANQRTHMLPIGGAFHTPWVGAAVTPFRAAVARTALREPAVPVWSCITAAPMIDPAADLARALTQRVRWRELVLALAGSGFETFHDVGPGSTLAKLVRRILRHRERDGALAPGSA
ncbi:MAG TPA: ACP S-malonyltransferase [Solirubrobacteraceae bacterium]|nr:ACP S-malonyltransferase [Solirubrobacteraceae bacterium]